jgi:hypothetical protein
MQQPTALSLTARLDYIFCEYGSCWKRLPWYCTFLFWLARHSFYVGVVLFWAMENMDSLTFMGIVTLLHVYKMGRMVVKDDAGDGNAGTSVGKVYAAATTADNDVEASRPA